MSVGEASKTEKVGNDVLQKGDQVVVNIAKAGLDVRSAFLSSLGWNV